MHELIEGVCHSMKHDIHQKHLIKRGIVWGESHNAISGVWKKTTRQWRVLTPIRWNPSRNIEITVLQWIFLKSRNSARPSSQYQDSQTLKVCCEFTPQHILYRKFSPKPRLYSKFSPQHRFTVYSVHNLDFIVNSVHNLDYTVNSIHNLDCTMNSVHIIDCTVNSVQA